ncbi:hbdH1, partial [Symbiodinium necroappetens]
MSNTRSKTELFFMPVPCLYQQQARHEQYPVEAETLFAGGESELAAMPKFSLYARLRAADEEAGKDRLRARLVWLLVVLETISLLCIPQVATLTHGAFFLIPLGALFLAAAIRLYSRPRILLAEPLCVLWPDNHSRHGLAREQAPNLCFGGFVWALKLVCALTFWTSPAAFSFLGDGCPDAVPRPNCSHYTREQDGLRFCMDIQNRYEPGNAKRKGLYEQGGACANACYGCGPSGVDPFWTGILIVHRKYCYGECALSCCQCLHCQLSPAVPFWLKQGCSAGAFAPDFAPELFRCVHGCINMPMPNRLPYYEAQTPSFENGMLAQLARCTLLVHGEESTQVKIAVAVVSALQCLPLTSLVACLLVSILVHLLKGGSASVMLGAVPVELETIEAIDAKAAQLQDQIRHRRLESSPKVKFQLWMDFVVFLVDYLSDYNCLRTFIVEGAYGVAAVQAVIIAAPVVLDCYRGKIQPVQVFGGFMESRKRGFPTDDFILALRSEKSLEAPLSMFLQFYTLLRSTRSSSIWSLCISMPLSILGIAKHVYATFELQILEGTATLPSTYQGTNQLQVHGDQATSIAPRGAALPITVGSSKAK